MTGHIIPLHGDPHRRIQSLLPWYVAGALEPAEQAEVRAHLDHCAECQAELIGEQRLAAEMAELPQGAGGLDVDHGWDLISRQMAMEPQPSAPSTARRRRFARPQFGRQLGMARFRSASGPWLGWAVAAQFCLIVLLGAQVWRMASPAQYHALGAAPVNAAANVIVIFRPETQEKTLREILKSNDARLVDGPTVSDAYLLHVPAGGRDAVLARLRRQAEVVLAEPVDGGTGR